MKKFKTEESKKQMCPQTEPELSRQELMDRELLLESILDDSNQLIQLSDYESFTMLYANAQAKNFTSHPDQSYRGKHCYEYMMGLKEQCPFCPMRQMEEKTYAETEVDNGTQIFAVKTKIINWKGRKAFIEYAWDITQIRRSQNIFEAQMRTLLQSIPEAQGIMHMDLTDDVCLSLNGASNSMKDFEQHVSVDQTVHMMASYVPDQEGQEAVFQTFCREALLASYAKGNVEVSRETDSYFDDGSIRSARVTARMIMNPKNEHLECVLYGMDISEEKRERLEYERSIKEQLAIFNALSRDYLNVFLINAKAGTAKILKLDGYVTSGLDKTKDIEYPYYATCIQYIDERVHPEDRNKMKEALRLDRVLDVLEKAPEYVSSYRTLTDGESHDYQFKYIRLEESGQIIAGFQNIDAIIAQERKQKELLTTALAAAQQSNQAKTVFLNNISHDMRTPLNAIIGFTELASTHVGNRRRIISYLSKIHTAGEHLLSLINDVLDMSHIESGKAKVEEVPVCLSDLVRELQTITQNDAAQKQIGLSFQMKNLKHKNIMADPLKLKKIFLNILSNAIKFTPPGGRVSFLVKESRKAAAGYATFKFYIQDTGIGIGEEFKPHIFEAFSREQSSTLSGVPGTGLGMSIVKSLVDLLGGYIDFESTEGEGTRFFVTLQFRIVPEDENGCLPEKEHSAKLPLQTQSHIANKKAGEAAPTREGVQEEKENIFAGKRILLVEDNELNREIAVELLEEQGLIMDTAENGKKALEKLKAAPVGTYDLILMDIQMPEMDGYECARTIRALPDPEKSEIPIYAMTANAFEEDRQNARSAGMNGHIAKPIDIDCVLETIRESLE